MAGCLGTPRQVFLGEAWPFRPPTSEDQPRFMDSRRANLRARRGILRLPIASGPRLGRGTFHVHGAPPPCLLRCCGSGVAASRVRAHGCGCRDNASSSKATPTRSWSGQVRDRVCVAFDDLAPCLVPKRIAREAGRSVCSNATAPTFRQWNRAQPSYLREPVTPAGHRSPTNDRHHGQHDQRSRRERSGLGCAYRRRTRRGVT